MWLQSLEARRWAQRGVVLALLGAIAAAAWIVLRPRPEPPGPSGAAGRWAGAYHGTYGAYAIGGSNAPAGEWAASVAENGEVTALADDAVPVSGTVTLAGELEAVGAGAGEGVVWRGRFRVNARGERVCRGVWEADGGGGWWKGSDAVGSR